MSEVEKLLEAQILRATERENALEKKFVAFEELASKNQEASNSKIADLKQQVESLKSALGGIGKPFDDGYGGSGATSAGNAICDSAVDSSAATAPTVQTSDDGSSIDIVACKGKVAFHSEECTVDPCALQESVRQVRNRLEKLAALP